MKSYDAIVIGAGPAGLAAALYLCRSGLHVALVEKLSPGGQLLTTSEIDNYPGFPKGTEGWSLAETFAAHLEGYTLDRFSEEVRSLSVKGNRHHIQFDKETLEAKAVILCSGASPRKLGVEKEEQLTGRGISYCAMCDGMFFKGQDVAMVGGGNAALEEALYLSKLVKKLYLVHRRDDFRADKVYHDKLKASSENIEFVLSHTVAALHGEDGLNSVTVASVKDGKTRELAVSGLFIFVGMAPVTQFVSPEIPKDQWGFIVTDTEMRTTIPGFFAAGDVRSKLCRQVVTAVGDGATAAHSAFAYIEQLKD